MTLLSIHPPSTYDQRKIAERTRGIRGLHVVLLKPSKYDDDGYVLRHWRGCCRATRWRVSMRSPKMSSGVERCVRTSI